MKKELVRLTNVHKSYIENTAEKALFNDLSFSIKRSEFVAVFGPNGCGKTTLLNIISGIDTDFTGTCERNSKLKVSFVFQNYRESLFPWLTVKENIAFPLALQGISSEKREKLVNDLCERFSFAINLAAYPYMLSGGQQQLVSILRALITKPDLLLMDEPFSALDYETTLFLLEKTQEIWEKTRVAIVFVSHEVDDAVLLAERIVVLGRNPSRIVSEIKDILPYPRDNTCMRSEDFHQTKNKVLSAFLRGYKKSAATNLN
jgi:NitT/TauT family transport system ATP-binding protein